MEKGQSGLGRLLQQTRERLRLSQADVAAQAEMQQRTLSSIERGRIRLPSVSIRRRLAETYDLSPVDLLIAAGELDRDEITAWMSRQPPTGVDPNWPDWLADLVAELSETDLSERLRLVQEAARLTREEAVSMVAIAQALPTEAQKKRRAVDEGKMTPGAYRQWRINEDALALL